MAYFDIAKNELLRAFSCMPGPKVLSIDEHIKSIISSFFLHSDLLSHEIFSVVIVESCDRESFTDVPCIVILSTLTDKFYQRLLNPTFNSYYLFFSKIIDSEKLRYIANADKNNVLKRDVLKPK